MAVIALGCIAAAAAVEGVGAVPGPPRPHWPAAPELPANIRAVLAREPEKLAADAETRRIEMMTLRIRNISCGKAAIGSGFAVNAHTLISNRHVLAGAAVLQADTWDGRTIDLDVSQATTGRLVDIGAITVQRPLPIGPSPGPEPRPGAAVTAVGYPLGGALTITHGRLIGYVDGRTLSSRIGFDGRVMEVSAAVQHGNSGGPLLDSDGRLIGVVYAAAFPSATTGSPSAVAYALPLTSIGSLLAQGGSDAVKPCGL